MPTTTDLYELTLTGQICGQFCQNVLHVEVTHDSADDPYIVAQGVAGGFVDNVMPQWHDCLPILYTQSSIRARQISGTGGPTYTQTDTVGGTTGSRTGDTNVPFIGPIIEFPVLFDKWVWGKIFVPGIADPDIVNNVIQSALQANLAIFIEAILEFDGSGTQVCKYVVKKHDSLDYAAPTNGQVSPTIGTQRRRNRPAF